MGTILVGCAFLLTLFLSACHYQWLQDESSTWRRAGFGSGFVAVVSLAVLAGVWPSAHTFLALPALPALVVFVGGVFSPGIASRLMRFFASNRTAAPPERFTDLTEREHQILILIGQGKTNSAIAAELTISVKTVRNHVSNIFNKLQVVDRAQAALRARDAGL